MSSAEKNPDRINRFRRKLERGDFSLLIEHPSPGDDNDLAAAKERLALLENALKKIDAFECSLAITDGYGRENSFRAIEYGAGLSEEERDRHLMYLSCRSLNREEKQRLFVMASENGLPNIAVAGGSPGSLAGGIREMRKTCFADSVNTIAELKHDLPDFCIGAVTNPMQYTSFALTGQYAKLMKKIVSGAEFVVTQANWDMLKLQSLLWYMTERRVFIPVIARLVLLTPEKVEAILENRMPGVHISPDLQKILYEEMRFSRRQFEAAQYRRLALQAAGCRLLGCSGIQIAGADTPELAGIVADIVKGALREFDNFEDYLEDYNAYLARAEMAPSSDSFNLYDRTLRRNYPGPDQPPPRMNPMEDPETGGWEKFMYSVRKFFFSHASSKDAQSHRLLKKLLVSCRGCRHCRLVENEYVCVMNCPKRQLNGPCGAVLPDGRCTYTGDECVQHRISRYACAYGNLARREEYIDRNDEE